MGIGRLNSMWRITRSSGFRPLAEWPWLGSDANIFAINTRSAHCEMHCATRWVPPMPDLAAAVFRVSRQIARQIKEGKYIGINHNHARPSRFNESISHTFNRSSGKLRRSIRARDNRSSGGTFAGSKTFFKHTITSLFRLRWFLCADVLRRS